MSALPNEVSFNPGSIWDAKARRFKVLGQPGLQSKTHLLKKGIELTQRSKPFTAVDCNERLGGDTDYSRRV